MDPAKIGEALGQAQDIQTVLGIFIGLLLLALMFLVKLWMADRLGNTVKLGALELAQAGELSRRDVDLAAKETAWERERADHHQSLQLIHEAHTTKVEELMREMLSLAMGVEKALDQLHRRARPPSDTGPV
ncbi:hypothetical protein LCGC14_0274080 [marine sediment metagenome]|uniref:Uncharacterized protein n=2 Tax=root TaxID=1 RepID=A0A9C9TFX2_9HYPH|nr:hypothetical protein [Aurantimonas coralicida]